MSPRAACGMLILLTSCDGPTYHQVSAYDVTHNRDYEAEIIRNDGRRAVIHIINGGDINIRWNDCPEFDTSGRKTGKLLPQSVCHDPKDYEGRDAAGTEWTVDMLPSQ